MVDSQILVETRQFERRAVVFDGDRPIGLFHESELLPRGLRLGTVHAAVLLAQPSAFDGGFCKTQGGEDVYVRFAKGATPPLGQRLTVEIVAEAQGGKAARGRPVAGERDDSEADPFQAWCNRVSEVIDVQQAHGTDAQARIDLAFEQALSREITLPGGGQLRLARTPALTAVDIDTSGRVERAGRSALARAVNLEAAAETARQLALRGLGGLVVLDCVAPVSKALGAEVKTAFLDAFRAVSPRRVAALAPSPFGLLEASLAWAERPIDEVFMDGSGQLSPQAQLLEGLRRLERDIEQRPAASLTLALPEAAYIAIRPFMGSADRLAGEVSRRLGPNIQIEKSPHGRVEVIRR